VFIRLDLALSLRPEVWDVGCMKERSEVGWKDQRIWKTAKKKDLWKERWNERRRNGWNSVSMDDTVCCS